MPTDFKKYHTPGGGGLSRRGHFATDARTRRSLPLIGLASLLMAGELLVAAQWLEPWLAIHNPVLVRSAALSVLVGSGMAVYFVAAYLTGALRIGSLRQALSRRG